MNEPVYFAQKVRFEIDGGDDLNPDFLSKRMMALYSVTADFMNDGGIKEFNDNYDNLTEYPMDVEIYDWLYDCCFTEMANKIADAYSAKLPGGRTIYLGDRSAFVFDPETKVTVMKGYIR